MTKLRPQKMAARRQPRRAKVTVEEPVDVCELLVAELQARRTRLKQLLNLVWQEVERAPAGRAAARTHRRQTAPAKRMA